MSKLNHILEKELLISAFSEENLKRLLVNSGIRISDKSEPKIIIEPNLDLRISPTGIEDTNLQVPLFYLSVEEHLSATENEKELLKEVLNIQKKASQDNPMHAHHYVNSIFRKLVTAIAELQLLQMRPEVKVEYYTNKVINKLIKDAQNKIDNIEIEYYDSEECFYKSKKVTELSGWAELLDNAKIEALEFDVFKYINEYIIKCQDDNKEIQYLKEKSSPILLSLSSPSVITAPASVTIGRQLTDFNKNFSIIRIENMRNFIWYNWRL